MTKLIDLGLASEETKGTFINSVQLDPEGVKDVEGTKRYRTSPNPGDGMKTEDND